MTADYDVSRLRHLHQVLGWEFRRTPSELIYLRRRGEWLDVLRVRSTTDAMVGCFCAESIRVGRPRHYWLFEGTLTEALDRTGAC